MKETEHSLLLSSIKLLKEDDEAFAEMNLNPFLLWLKFTLTDDKPNNNHQIVPKEEFSQLIESGLYMPIKMEEGGPGHHEGSAPIGVITHLKETKRGDSNLVVGLGALWTKERSEDITILTDRYAEEKPLDLSWELFHSDAELDEDGNQILKGTTLRAVTLVSIPAYGGRTAVEEIYSSNSQQKEDNTLDDEILKALNVKLEEEKDALKEEVDTAKEVISELESKIENLESNQVTEEIKASLETLKELEAFKEEIDEATAQIERDVEIKDLFEAAEVSVNDEYFDNNLELLRGMDNDQVSFVITQVKDALESTAEDNSDKEGIPMIKGSKPQGKLSAAELAEALRQRRDAKYKKN